MLSVAEGNNLVAFKLLAQWVHESFDPPKLKEKDSRNPFLINRRNEEIKILDDKLEEIKKFLITAPTNSVGST